MVVVRAVLFDLDDTLVDHLHASRVAVAGVRETFAALQARDLEAMVAENDRLVELLHADVGLGRRSAADARIERYRQLFAFAEADATHAPGAAELHRRLYMQARREVPGAAALLAALHGTVTIAVVTNNTVAEQSEKLRTFGLACFVDALVTSEEAGAAKPDGAIFRMALARCRCTAEGAVMVGDSWRNDVEGAQRAGIRPLWFNRLAMPAPDPSVDVVTSLEPTWLVADRILGSAAAGAFAPPTPTQ
ncbi:MAG: HAD family hydrolase [Casimicrobiaceae bacterium]